MKYIIIVILFVSFSCNKEKRIDINDIFPEKYKLKAQYFKNHEMLGFPLQILVNDSLLIVNEFRDDYLIYFYNKETGRLLKKVAKTGRGPNEFIPPIYIRINSKNQLIIYERRRFNIRKYIVNTDLSLKPIFKVKFSNKSQQVYQVKDNYILATGFYDKYRFAVYDSLGNKIETFGNYPEIKIIDKSGKTLQLNNDTKTMLFQSIINVAQESNKFIVANTQFGLLELYKKNIDIYTKTDEFSLINYIRLKNYSSGNTVKANTADSYPKGFTDLRVSKKYIYALYSGNSKNTPAKVSYIMVFSWNLKPVSLYILDRVVNTFDISNNKIYAISKSKDEPQLIYFNL